MTAERLLNFNLPERNDDPPGMAITLFIIGRLVDMQRYIVCVILMALAGQPVYAQDAIDPNDGAALCAAGKTGYFLEAVSRAAKGSNPRISNASPGFDVTYYELSLDLDPDRFPILQGTVVVGGRATEPMTFLQLDLADPMSVTSVSSRDGTMLDFSEGFNFLRIGLPSPVDAGQIITVSIDYAGTPSNSGYGSFSVGQVNGNPYIWTLSEPYGARDWWPNVDHPSDKADSVRMRVTVPEALRAGSNGLLVSETVNGDGTATYEWMHRYPIASYLVSLAIGRYDVYEQTYVRPDSLAAQFGALSLPILHYAYEGSNVFEGGAQSGWKHVVEILPVFEHWFGPYPFPAEKYGHAHVTFGGGMEHQTMTSLGGSGWGLVAHELAHMWYGDMITNRTWPHLWLHEGFATMAELLFWESDPARYGSTPNYIFDLYYARARQASGTLVVEDTSTVGSLFSHSRVYSKGAMVLHMLRGMVGDDTFRDIMRSYSADEAVRYGTATTDDFDRVASSASGLDLTTFFDEWARYGTGYPSYELSWIGTSDLTGPGVLVEVRQIQDATQSNISVFEMPIELVVQTDAGPVSFTVFNDHRVQTFFLPVAGVPVDVEMDPSRKILRADEIPVSMLPPPTEFKWSVFPNPARDELRFRFDFPTESRITVRLYDAIGRLVFSYDLGEYRAGTFIRSVALPEGTASGVYVVELSSADRVVSQTIVIVR